MEIKSTKTILKNFPSQLEQGLKWTKKIKGGKEYKEVVICGMGGSGLPGDILLNWINEEKIKTIPIFVNKNYTLPFWANKKTLVIIISYSGNTEETISCLKEAQAKNFSLLAISSNGKIKDIAQKNNFPFIEIKEKGIQPRMALGFIFASLVQALENLKIIKNKSKEIKKIGEQLKKINFENKGRILAEKIYNKIPLIYSSEKLKSLAEIWKIKFNENSKIPAFYNCLPELNHNEMNGFFQSKYAKNFYILFLKDPDDHPRIKKRMKILSVLLRKKGLLTHPIEIKKGKFLFKLFSGSMLADWTSYYLALKQGIDPEPVKMVEEFKKMLKNK